MLRGISNHNFLRVQETKQAVRVESGAWILNIAVHSGLSLVQPQGTRGGGTVFLLLSLWDSLQAVPPDPVVELRAESPIGCTVTFWAPETGLSN